MRKGNRVPGAHNGNHLCLTNPGLLKAFSEKVKARFRHLPPQCPGIRPHQDLLQANRLW